MHSNLNPSLFTVKRLNSNMDVSGFSCSESKLNEYLKEDALRDQQYFYSTTNLVYYNDALIGYFTLITDSMGSDRVDKDIVIKYEYARLPSVKIARLAVDSRYAGQGIGRVIMSLIYSTVFDMIQNIGCRLITVDAKNSAKGFYEKFQFKTVNAAKEDADIITMYLDVKVLVKILNL